MFYNNIHAFVTQISDLQSSVRFILNVSSQEKMADMCQFYFKLLQTSGVSTTSNGVCGDKAIK